MSKVGYCGGCGRYVELREDRSCVNGHPVSMIRDVRDSAPAAVASPAGAKPSASAPARVASDPAKRADAAVNTMVKVSWVLTVVGVTGLLVLGTFLALPQFTAMGMSTPMAWLTSAGSTAVTLGAAVAWAQMRKRNRR